MPLRSVCLTILLVPLALAQFGGAAESTARAPAQLAAELCATCHGVNLTGNAGPNLLDTFWNHGGDDESVLRSIAKGWPESGMPGFAGALSEEEMRGLVAYLREQGREFAAGRITLPVTPESVTLDSERHRFRLETWIDYLDTPWGLEFLPDGRALVTERPGRLRVIENGRLDPEPIRGLPAVWLHQDGGLLDVIAHPQYAENGWIYLAYSEGWPDGMSMTVVVRGRIRAGEWVDQETIFRAPPEHYHKSFIHYGCRFLFDEAGHLFFTIGDRGEQDEAQDLRSPCGKIHRVLDDGRIPPDNPFVYQPGAWPSIWSYGNRHAQGLAFHPVTGKLWAAEHGPRHGDEINRIEPGRNYGWPVITHGTEGRGRKIGVGTEHPGMEQPIVYWSHSLAACALEFYTGDRFPEWKHHLFLTALGGQQLRRLVTEGDRVLHQEILVKDLGRVRDAVTGPDGLLYIVFNAPGRIARLVPVEE